MDRNSFPPHYATKNEKRKSREQFVTFLKSINKKNPNILATIKMLEKLLEEKESS